MSALRFTREQFIEALEARRPWAEQYDAKNLAEHQKAEKQWLAAYRRALRAALKWDYATAKNERSPSVRDEDGRLIYPPSCPKSMVTLLDQTLAAVRATGQKTFTITDRSDTWPKVHHLLTFDETIPAEMC